MIELEEAALIQELCEEPFVIDGGAGHGAWTQMVLSLRPKAKMVLFEPHPRHVEILKCRFRGVKQVVIYERALSDRVLPSILHIDHHPGFDDFGSSLYLRKHHQASVSVFSAALAQYPFRRIDLLKLDVEGAELPAIRGLGGHRPAFIQFEYGGTWEDAGFKLSEAYTELESRNYRVRQLFTEEDYTYRNLVAEYQGGP